MRFASLSSLLLGVLLVGCSATSGPNQFGVGGAGGAGTGAGSSGSGDVGGGSFVDAGDSTGSGSGGDCSEAATFIYVLADDNTLYSFRPDKKLFTFIGALGCPTNMQPNSMAVDRDAVAWVNYVESDPLFGDTGGAIFKVSTKDASCQSAQLPLPANWFRDGMGYSTDTAEGASETLYIASTGDPFGGGGLGLAKFDTMTNQVKPIGPFTGALEGFNAELTGTGDGRLFGFFTTSPVQVAEINKATGAILSAKSLPQVQTPAAWAFSFWGGDFYLYTSDGFSDSTVTRYRPSDGSVDPAYMTNIGFKIVGAGVSTCAPLEPPK